MERATHSQDGMAVIDLGSGNSTYAGELQRKTTSSGGVIYPFSPTKGVTGKVLRTKRGRNVSLLLAVNIACTCVLLVWCHSTNSMALTAMVYLTVFDILSLLTALVSVWVNVERSSTSVYSFGYERFEVLAVFSSTMLTQLGSFFIFKESMERIMEPTDVHTGRLLPGIVLALVVHLLVTYSVDNIALQHTITTSHSSWLQEQITDMSESLCQVVPGLGRHLLPRINPLALLGWVSAILLVLVHLAIDLKGYVVADTLAAFLLALLTFVTMLPMSALSGRVLLQTTPSHVSGALDKCLREASTLDGVLEFRSEHFWVIAYGKLAGSVHVRVRRDANEQLVLAHVTSRLSSLVPVLTVQIYKDDWASRPSAYSTFHPNATPNQSALTPTLGQGVPGIASSSSTALPFVDLTPVRGGTDSPLAAQRGLEALQAAAAHVDTATSTPVAREDTRHRSHRHGDYDHRGMNLHGDGHVESLSHGYDYGSELPPRPVPLNYRQEWPRTSTPMVNNHFGSSLPPKPP